MSLYRVASLPHSSPGIHHDSHGLACPCGSKNVRKKGFSKPVLCTGTPRQRLKCKDCRRSFSENIASLNYRFQHLDLALNAKILALIFHGTSNRNIARSLFVSEHCIRIRIRRLAQRALEFHSKLLWDSRLSIKEALCYDGFENFASSQYDPNNINHLIGKDSLFIYDFSFASLNRKGRTSPWQKIRLAQIEAEHGRYNPKAIRVATARILKRVHPMCENKKMQLLSDEHFQYKRSLNNELRHLSIEHLTISSKACRNFQNILFSVNHADLLIRHKIAAFARETISFSKTPATMCQRYALFLVHKNYMQPQFTKKHVRRPHAHERSPAQTLGLSNKILGFSDIFNQRSLQKPKHLSAEWAYFYNSQIPPDQRRHKKFMHKPSTQYLN